MQLKKKCTLSYFKKPPSENSLTSRAESIMVKLNLQVPSGYQRYFCFSVAETVASISCKSNILLNFKKTT